jgi:hypothetical protein
MIDTLACQSPFAAPQLRWTPFAYRDMSLLVRIAVWDE